ncbi:MAG: hypothetical protein IH905_04770 [Proteobacteria bacterium]|nr:hypothetical protein [Pseudomonadota bacterium]
MNEAAQADTVTAARSKRFQPPPASGPQEHDDEGFRKEVFTLGEGDVILTFPENLSPESYSDLEDHFGLFLKKAKRRAHLTQIENEVVEKMKATRAAEDD